MQARCATNITGIDVSHHQNNIDWTKVARDKQGIKFAYVKATEGRGYTDPQFRRNAVGAPAVGLKVGFYHYARPESGNTAAQEAADFIAATKGLPADLPHVLDIEGAASSLGRDKLTEWCYQWLSTVKRITGHKVMLYTGGSFARSYLGPKLAEFPLWIAHYGGVQTPMNNPTWARWSVFQHSSSGRVDGIATGNVDMNVMECEFWDTMFPPVVKPAELTEAEKIKAAVKIIAGENGVADPDYWIEHCVEGKTLNGPYVGSLIKNMARVITRLKG